MKKPQDKVDLVLRGLTRQQADALAHWYVASGEQRHYIWFQDRDIPSPLSNVSRKGGAIKEEIKQIILYLKTP